MQKIEATEQQDKFNNIFNAKLPINTQYILSELSQFGFSPTTESDFNKPYLTKNLFPELAQKFKDHQMNMKSGITP